jgi:hypothetical protein
MGVALNYADEVVIPFEDDTYRWVSVKRFELTGHGATAAVLAVLVGHSAYRDDDPDRPRPQARHGPYDAGAITPEAFEPIDPARLPELVEELYRLHDGPPTPAVRERIDAAADLLRAAECHRLRHLPEAVVMGGAFLEFQEVVGIDRAGRAVFLLVLAADV